MSSTNYFSDDALGRSRFANNLSKHITKIKTGVVAIDGAWGSGKSWFGERLKKQLEGDDIKCVWIDTFDADWHDDPALSLLSSISEQLPEDKRSKFVEAVAPLAGKAMVAIGKAGLRVVGNFVGIDADTVNEISDITKDAGDEYIKKRLQELADRKRSLQSLKDLLAKAVDDCGGKVVVFVDELDRCSPAYAIRFLERIKHLFAIDGVVYVLLWNRAQIQNAVRVFYGQETDGQMYLDRFVDYPLHLPNHHLDNRVETMGLLVEAEVKSLSGNEQVQLHDAARLIGAFADVLSLTAREVKHVCNWWVMSSTRTHEVFELWLLCIKVKYPDLYKSLRIESVDAHQKATEILTAVGSSQPQVTIIESLRLFHQICVTREGKGFGEISRQLFNGSVSGPLSITSETISKIETR